MLYTGSSGGEQFYNSIVKPREYEADTRVLNGLREIMGQGKVSYYTKQKLKVPTYGQFLDQLGDQRKSSGDKPHYVDAIDEIRETILGYMDQHGFIENQEVNEEFVKFWLSGV